MQVVDLHKLSIITPGVKTALISCGVGAFFAFWELHLQTWLQTRCRRSAFKSVVAIAVPLVPGAGIEPARLSAGDFESQCDFKLGAA